MGKNQLSIGIEIGGTKTQVGIGSSAEGLLPGGIVRRPVQRENGADGILRDLAAMVGELLESGGLEAFRHQQNWHWLWRTTGFG